MKNTYEVIQHPFSKKHLLLKLTTDSGRVYACVCAGIDEAIRRNPIGVSMYVGYLEAGDLDEISRGEVVNFTSDCGSITGVRP